MREKDLIIETSHQRMESIHNSVDVYTRKLFIQLIFGHTVMIIKTGLSAPADMEGAVNIFL